MMPLEVVRCISTLYPNREAREEEKSGERCISGVGVVVLGVPAWWSSHRPESPVPLG
jgi:hypothetical protein